MTSPDTERRLREYASRHSLKFNLKEQLGEGTDGAVWATSRSSVIKVVKRERNYLTEFRCYERLLLDGISEIDGLAVPRLIECSHPLRIIEMTLVHPPFLLDFGKAYLDEPSPYTPEQLDEWRREWHRFFPRRDIPRVYKVLGILKQHGIEYVDPKPWNIRFHQQEVVSDDDCDDLEEGYEPYGYE